IALSSRYMNPRFKRHLYPQDWRTWDYWKRGLPIACPFPLLMLLFTAISASIVYYFKDLFHFTSDKAINSLLVKVYIVIPSIIASYFAAKKLMPKPGKANQYDRKTLDFQMFLMVMTLFYFIVADYLI